jgi:hypothetical protein
MFLRLPFKRNTKSNGFTVQETTHESWITAIKDCSSILLTTPDFKQERFRDSLCTLVQIELLLCVNATSLEHFAKELDRVEANIRNSVLIGTHEYDYMV